MNNFTYFKLLTYEKKRKSTLRKIREARPVKNLKTFLNNLTLIKENNTDFFEALSKTKI